MPNESFRQDDHGQLKSIGLPPEISTASSAANVSADDYFAVVLSSAAQVRSLRDSAKRLLQREDPTLSPEFFLASLGKKGWGPKVVAVCGTRGVIGILYAQQ